MISESIAVAIKDLRVERRSKVGLNQVLPFSLVVVLLFGFSLNTQSRVLTTIAPGLFWVAITFSSLYLISRTMRLERENGALDGLFLLGISSVSIFIGKLLALLLTIFVLEVIQIAAVVILFSVHFESIALICISTILATVGIGTVGLIYGSLASDDRLGESLVPLLVLPILAPIIIAATNCWSDALGNHGGLGDPWLVLLTVFAIVFLTVGVSSFGAILED